MPIMSIALLLYIYYVLSERHMCGDKNPTNAIYAPKQDVWLEDYFVCVGRFFIVQTQPTLYIKTQR